VKIKREVKMTDYLVEWVGKNYLVSVEDGDDPQNTAELFRKSMSKLMSNTHIESKPISVLRKATREDLRKSYR
jgi:GTP1/Obg family GTP-binding protein